MEATPSPPASFSLTQTELLLALLIALALSLLIACIEIPTKSKASLRSCLGIQSAIYCLVLAVGNAATTILAMIFFGKLPDGLWPYAFFLCAFFGVFAFETILKKTNVTMFDQGVLTIQDWIEKALNGAIGAAVEREENFKHDQDEKLVKKVMTLSEEDINTRVLNKLGNGVVEKLDAAAKASGANSKHYKAFQLIASLSRSECAAIDKLVK